jgi:hypothetical protein
VTRTSRQRAQAQRLGGWGVHLVPRRVFMSHAYGEESVDPLKVTRDPEGQRGEGEMHQAGRQCISALGAA